MTNLEIETLLKCNDEYNEAKNKIMKEKMEEEKRKKTKTPVYY